MRYDVILVGAGASGLAAAATAARRGCSVLLLERNRRAGKKLLATGNGRCNFTNRRLSAGCYRSDTPEEVGKTLSLFPVEEALRFLEGAGIPAAEKEGYFYPASFQASAVADLLSLECEDAGVTLVTCAQVIRTEKKKGWFQVRYRSLEDGSETVREGRSLVLACGSHAGLGAKEESVSRPDGYDFAKAFGHSVTPLYPALTFLKTDFSGKRDWGGVRASGRITVLADGQELGRDEGELQCTADGISGIPVFSVCRLAAEALDAGRTVRAVLDFFPDLDREILTGVLEKRRKAHPRRKSGELLLGLVNSRLVPVFLREAGIRGETVPEDGRWGEKLADIMKRLELRVTGTGDLASAQVCAGGVRLSEIRPDTMESRLVPGLYLTGELLDAEGICGGYNLHWAWATGVLAGRGIPPAKEGEGAGSQMKRRAPR